MNAAHDDYLQFLVETGMVGLFAFLGVVAVAISKARPCAIGWRERPAAAIGFAALIGVIGLVVHSFFDFNLQIPANAAVFFVLCTIASVARTVGEQTADYGYDRVVAGS